MCSNYLWDEGQDMMYTPEWKNQPLKDTHWLTEDNGYMNSNNKNPKERILISTQC